MTADVDASRARPILPDERTGVLHPQNLARYAGHWIAEDPAVAAAVDQYWHVAWALSDGERLEQRIIDLPAVTVTIEDGDVPAPLMVTGVQAGAWRRSIHGTGRVFALRLRPAGFAVVSDLPLGAIANRAVPLTEALDPRLHDLMSVVARERSPDARVGAADAAIVALLRERPPSETALLANAVLDALRDGSIAVTGLAPRFGVSERTVQRALTGTLGHGPKWVSRRVRLQAVALALVTRPGDGIAAIAADFGYADQSHLAGDLRAIAGITPGAYRRDMQRLVAG